MLFPVSIYRLSIVLAVACFTGFPQGKEIKLIGEDESVLREMVRKYYYAYEKVGLDGQFELWSMKSTDPVSNRERMTQSRAQLDQVKVEKLSVDKVVVSGDIVRLRITVNVKAVSNRTGKPVGGWMNRDAELTHLFVKEGTNWKQLEIRGTSQDLVEEIGALRTNEDRAQAIASAPGLVNREFVSELSGYGLDQGSQFSDHKKAAEILEFSMRLAQQLGDKELESQICAFMANNYMMLGDHGLALHYDNRHYELELTLGDKGNPANALNSLGVSYAILGDQDRAIELYEKSFDVKTGPPASPSRIARVRGNIGTAALAKGDLERAKKEFANVLEVAQTNNLKGDIAKAQIGLASVARATGEHQRALELYQAAWEVYNPLPDKGAVQGLLKQIAEAQLQLKNFPEAIRHSAEAVDLAVKMDVPDLAWDAHLTSARAYIGMGRRQEARAELERSIAIIEAMRNRVLGGEESVQRFFDSKSAPYAELASLLLDDGQVNEAFNVGERIKGRTLLSVLSGGMTRTGGGLTDGERARERGIVSRLAGINEQIRNEENPTKAAGLKSQLEDVRKEQLLFRNQLYAVHPELRARRVEFPDVTPATLSELTADGRTAIVSYVVAGGRVLGFVARTTGGKGGVTAFSVDIAEKDLQRKIGSFRDKVAAGDLDFQKGSRELYDLLVKPVGKDLVGRTNVVFVPDGPLWDLPFQALIDASGKYLVEKASVSYAPSLTALREMSKRAKKRNASIGMELLAFGNPIVGERTKERVRRVFMSEKLDPLPEAERLVNELGKMYGAHRSRVLTGPAAREEIAKSESSKYRIVQFATHGVLDNSSPMYSHLVLAQPDRDSGEDGLLEAWELKDMNIGADTVILSACETARGKVSRGEGMIGMTWAAFIAGAPTTVATQWKVESRSTTELMLEFHRQLLTGKVSKGEALRQAALKLKRTSQFSHPSYWAGFVIVGDAN